MTIHLIGTAHADFKGKERLERALNIEKPEILTVEASQTGIDDLLEHYESDYQRIIQILREEEVSESVMSFFKEICGRKMPYEIDVCREYSHATGIPLHLIDDPSMNKSLREELISLVTVLLGLIRHLPEQYLSREYSIIGTDLIYRSIQNLYDKQSDDFEQERAMLNPCRGTIIGKRDETEARNLRVLAKQSDVKIVHVGGCIHNFSDPQNQTLYSRLADLAPTRATLLRYDN